MGSLIEEVVPAAFGVVLVNPLPILAAILMLLSARGRSTAAAFVLGWGTGMAVVLGLLLFVVPADPYVGDESAPSTLSSVVRLAIGLGLSFLAVRQWRQRPDPEKTSSTPAWMAKLEKASPIVAFGFGAMMSGINPKNLAFNIAAVVAIAQAQVTEGERLIGTVLYVLLATVGVAAPVIWYLVDRERAREKLAAWKVWLTTNYRLIVAVVLFVFGIVLSSQGLGELLDARPIARTAAASV
jgi:threonine/homoserine/homoserine lactone efflux protein